MKHPFRLFPVLKWCAAGLERVLPKAVYIPIYRRCRELYDVHVLGNPPAAPGPLYAVPRQRAEEYEAVAAAAQQPAADPAEVVRLSPPVGGVITCDGTDHALPNPEQLTDGRSVRDALAPLRTECGMVICCSFMGRHGVLKRVIMESLSAENGDRVRWMLTGSTGEDREFIAAMARRTGRVAGMVVENHPLGRKWQTCVKYGYHLFDADLYVVNGSDDVIPARLVDHVFTRHAANRAALGSRVPYLYCTNEWLVHCRSTRYSPMLLKCSYRYENAFQPVGSGRFYSREYLDIVDGHVFDSTQGRTLDADGFLRGQRLGLQPEYYSLAHGPLVSVDGDWNQLNSLDYFFKSTTLSIREYAFEGYPLLRGALGADTVEYLFPDRKRTDPLF